MNRLLLLSLLLLSTPAFACDGGPLFEMMAAPLSGQPDKTFDVSEVGSTEGGGWEVYFKPDGKSLANLIRIDYGESGRLETRLIVSSPEAYAVTSTDISYSAPNYVSGSIAIREEKDIFVYCSGKLHLPEEDLIGLAPGYAKKAAEAMKTFDATEVAQYVSGLRR
jgi:hypothetical protein